MKFEGSDLDAQETEAFISIQRDSQTSPDTGRQSARSVKLHFSLLYFSNAVLLAALLWSLLNRSWHRPDEFFCASIP